MDQVQDHKLTVHQLLLDFPCAGPNSEESTSCSIHSYEHIIEQTPFNNETEWGAILRKLEESSALSAAEMQIDDHLRPPYASLHNPSDNEKIHNLPHIPMCSLMSSYVDGDNQLEAQLEMAPNDSSAVHIEYPRLSRSSTCPSTPGNSHLDSVLDELLISYNDHSSDALQESEDHRHHRHQQYYQNQQSFSHCLNHVHESGSCTPATSASSDEPLDMEESLVNKLECTVITELDHNRQQAHPGDEVSDKKRGSKGSLRVKKLPKKQRGSKLAIRMKSDVDIVDDGFKWRKYGQKAVKDSPYARSYYKCTDKRCGVKKLVERQCSEPDVVVTTYEGVHTHGATSNKDSINGPNDDLPDLCNPASYLDPISHYSTYLTSLNILAHNYIACTCSTYNDSTSNYNQLPLPPLSSSCLPSFPFVNQYPTTTPALHDSNGAPLDYKLRHHLLQLLMQQQDIDCMARGSSHSV